LQKNYFFQSKDVFHKIVFATFVKEKLVLGGFVWFAWFIFFGFIFFSQSHIPQSPRIIPLLKHRLLHLVGFMRQVAGQKIQTYSGKKAFPG